MLYTNGPLIAFHQLNNYKQRRYKISGKMKKTEEELCYSTPTQSRDPSSVLITDTMDI